MDSHVPGLRSLCTCSLTHPEQCPVLQTPFMMRATFGCTMLCLLYCIPAVPFLCLNTQTCVAMLQSPAVFSAVTCRARLWPWSKRLHLSVCMSAPYEVCVTEQSGLVPHFSERVLVVKWLVTIITNKSQESSFPLAITYSVKTLQMRNPCLCLPFFPTSSSSSLQICSLVMVIKDGLHLGQD